MTKIFFTFCLHYYSLNSILTLLTGGKGPTENTT
nr:MAG TPA: hypothetical protein [Caudoviricetes sp.]